jgi:hypothetical protein
MSSFRSGNFATCALSVVQIVLPVGLLQGEFTDSIYYTLFRFTVSHYAKPVTMPRIQLHVLLIGKLILAKM